MAFDHQGSLGNLLEAFEDPEARTFAVSDLMPTTAAAAGATEAQGSIALDATDPERVRILVTVEWRTRRGERRLQLPGMITEIAR